MLTFSVPNSLILDTSLPKSARRLGIAMYAHRSRYGKLCKKQSELAALSQLSEGTIRKGIAALSGKGYIQRKRRRFYSAAAGLRNAASCYELNLLALETGYTKLPRSLLTREMTDATFCVIAYLFYAAGHKRRAYPSVKEITKATHTARSTVFEALKVVKQLPEMKVEPCLTRYGDYAAHSYKPCKVTQDVSPVFSEGVVRNLTLTRYHEDNEGFKAERKQENVLPRVIRRTTARTESKSRLHTRRKNDGKAAYRPMAVRQGLAYTFAPKKRKKEFFSKQIQVRGKSPPHRAVTPVWGRQPPSAKQSFSTGFPSVFFPRRAGKAVGNLVGKRRSMMRIKNYKSGGERSVYTQR